MDIRIVIAVSEPQVHVVSLWAMTKGKHGVAYYVRSSQVGGVLDVWLESLGALCRSGLVEAHSAGGSWRQAENHEEWHSGRAKSRLGPSSVLTVAVQSSSHHALTVFEKEGGCDPAQRRHLPAFASLPRVRPGRSARVACPYVIFLNDSDPGFGPALLTDARSCRTASRFPDRQRRRSFVVSLPTFPAGTTFSSDCPKHHDTRLLRLSYRLVGNSRPPLTYALAH